MAMITFLYKWAFCLIIIPFLYYFFKEKTKLQQKALKIPFFEEIEEIKNKGLSRKISSLNLVKILVWLLWLSVIIAAARPQSLGVKIPITQDNRVIILVIDASGSMKEDDFILGRKQVSRFTAMKKVISDFIKERTGDKIGLVLFGSNAYIYAPPSDDIESLLYLLDTTEPGLAGENTAIGDGLAMAVKMVQDLPKDKRVAILLSDGVSNTGALTDEQALSLLKENKMQVYTIGIGSGVNASFFGFNVHMNPSVDEEALSIIASETGGKFYMAQNTKELADIYGEISRLEPISNDEKFYQPVTELFYIPLAFSILISAIIVFMVKGEKNV